MEQSRHDRLEDAIARYFQPDVGSYPDLKCGNCGKDESQVVEKQIYCAPEYLRIRLELSVPDEYGGAKVNKHGQPLKNKNPITIPDTLDLSRYVYAQSGEVNPLRYETVSKMSHVGKKIMISGHYVAGVTAGSGRGGLVTDAGTRSHYYCISDTLVDRYRVVPGENPLSAKPDRSITGEDGHAIVLVYVRIPTDDVPPPPKPVELSPAPPSLKPISLPQPATLISVIQPVNPISVIQPVKPLLLPPLNGTIIDRIINSYRPHPRGLGWEGTTCYRTAALQALLHLPLFVGWILLHNTAGQNWACNNGRLNNDSTMRCVPCVLKTLILSYWGDYRMIDIEHGRYPALLSPYDPAILPVRKLACSWSMTSLQDSDRFIVSLLQGCQTSYDRTT